MRYSIIALLGLALACSETTDSITESEVVNDTKTDETEIAENTDSTLNNTIEEAPEIDEQFDEGESSEYVDLDWQAYEEAMTKDFSFVILISTKSYDAALERAEEASEKLGYPMDLRDLHPNEESGLSLPRRVCEEEICGGGVIDYPLYMPRTDWGDSKYVSVEYSNGYDGFTPGYYIVIVASGEKGDPIIEEALNEARVFYEDAYAKTCGVWLGCSC